MSVQSNKSNKDKSSMGDENVDEDPLYNFSFKLEDRCVRHFEFLKALHEAGVTKRVTSESLRRYLLWFKMLAKMGSKGAPTKLQVPPKDVAWLWHCHRLAPTNYQEFVQQICHSMDWTQESILEWKDPAGDPYVVESNAISRRTWMKYYPNESYDLDRALDEKAATIGRMISPEDATLLAGFDLLASAKNQAEFYWQIQPLFDCQQSFNASLYRYQRFMKLFQMHPSLSFKLVPTYEIDFMWHTHMTGGTAYNYRSDCISICGKVIEHDDSYGDGDREGTLNDAFERTAKLWSLAYKDDTYISCGGYRGLPPTDYFTDKGEKNYEILDPKVWNDSLVDPPAEINEKEEIDLATVCWKVAPLCAVLGIFFVVAIMLVVLGLHADTQSPDCGSNKPDENDCFAQMQRPVIWMLGFVILLILLASCIRIFCILSRATHVLSTSYAGKSEHGHSIHVDNPTECVVPLSAYSMNEQGKSWSDNWAANSHSGGQHGPRQTKASGKRKSNLGNAHTNSSNNATDFWNSSIIHAVIASTQNMTAGVGHSGGGGGFDGGGGGGGGGCGGGGCGGC